MSAVSSAWGQRRPSLTWARLIVAFILTCSLVMWGLGIGLYIGVYRTPLSTPEPSPYAGHYPERGWLYAWACGLPTITSLLSIIELACAFVFGLNPLVSLLWSAASATAWIFMFTEWFGCEVGMDLGGGDRCDFYLLDNEPYNSFTPSGSGRGLWAARLAFAMIIALTYVAYMGLASAALHNNVQEAKKAKAGVLEKEAASD